MKNELTARRLQSALSNINMTQQELSENPELENHRLVTILTERILLLKKVPRK